MLWAPCIALGFLDLSGSLNCTSAFENLNTRQRRLCNRFPEAANIVLSSMEMAKTTCERDFAKESWNCSRSHTAKDSKEAAYISAFGAALAASKVAQECSSGRLDYCGCGRSADARQSSSIPGCSDNIKFGASFSKKFFQLKKMDTEDIKFRVQAHNIGVGLRVLRSNRVKRCKCHGIGKTCTMKTCWWAVPTVDGLSALLKEKYNSASKVLTSNIELIVAETSLPAATTQLVFLKPSANFCDRVRGRPCDDDAHCESLCCGRGFRKESRMVTEQCRCQFFYCCEIRCESCLKVVEDRFCL
ncbi:hypothetical protein QR680_003952 [Steinernema hermaphroditum]|uniref:Protein Wnt n=1 Tax=Steinernema hermaphroditum TaxID=289476 RepID=A0AA39HM66_9BILA|nr:hypothetical protein QR680_003952 [Steinernema hermaphroditum]